MKISFLSLTASLFAATVPYLTSAALEQDFGPEYSASASKSRSLPDYSKVFKNISKRKVHQTLKLSIPSSSSNEEEEEGGITDRHLEDVEDPYVPSVCVLETMTYTGTGGFSELNQELVGRLSMQLANNFSDVCHLGFDQAICIVDGTEDVAAFEEYCTEGTVESVGLERICVDEDDFVTYTLFGLPGCLSNSCDSLSDFIDNVNLTWFEENMGEEPEEPDLNRRLVDSRDHAKRPSFFLRKLEHDCPDGPDESTCDDTYDPIVCDYEKDCFYDNPCKAEEAGYDSGPECRSADDEWGSDEEEDGCMYSSTKITYWDESYEDKFYCDDNDGLKGVFLYSMKNGEPKFKTCDWLDQFPMELKYIQCSKESPSGYPSAADACPKACCRCKEHPEDRFFVKMKENKKGKLKAKTKECSRIDDIDDPFFKYELCHRESQKPKLVGNGNAVCPQSCGTCPSPEMFMDDDEDKFGY